MKAKAMTEMWLRDTVLDLRRRATKAENAYKTVPLRTYCHKVASAYREAADVIAAHADRLAEEVLGDE